MTKSVPPGARALACALALLLSWPAPSAPGPAPRATPYPVLFVTQVPWPYDFTTVNSTFGNHQGDLDAAPRGGDLWIRYPDGTLKNLTETAGLGTAGFQGTSGIAVREPSVHWSGTKALFSMVVGSPAQQYQGGEWYWQLYEVTGLGPTETPVIRRVEGQPADFNNVSPVYGRDDRILFTSDRPRSGERHLWPQLDEYEEAPTVTGIWALDPATGSLTLLNHSPSGAFSPSVDSFGRVVFTRWDHLQRDQQADADATGPNVYGTFDYADESAGAARLDQRVEVFPEPRPSRTDLLAGTNLNGHTLNHFFPWQVNEDGTEEETLVHVGRHDLHSYFDRVFDDDPNLVEFVPPAGRANPNPILNMFQVREDPLVPGRYVGVDAPEFATHASGQVIAVTAPPTLPADQLAVAYLTPRATFGTTPDGQSPSPDHSGHYRNPLPLSDGTLVAAHSADTRADANTGTRAAPGSRYAFRLKPLVPSGGTLLPGAPLTPGLAKTVSFWDPDVLVSYSGPLWELDPVEVRPRPRPARRVPALAPQEEGAFAAEGVEVTAFARWLRQNGLALIVSRNVTTRDEADRQQPFNLKVAGSSTQTLGASGKLYEVAHQQLFQADQLRGLGGTASPRPGRRVLARVQHDGMGFNPPNPLGPASSVPVAPDGSVAALVPAHRAVTWMLTDAAGTGVVRERYWLTFQPGEIRLCTSCHGLSSRDQAGQGVPANEPQALRTLLSHWKATAAPPPLPPETRFYTTTPCRLVDTRRAGASPLVPGGERLLAAAGVCGVPADARALSVNVTVTEPTAGGNLRLYPGDSPVPLASSINFRAGQTRANNAVVPLAADGSAGFGVRNDAPGTVHLVVDVNGYFR